MSTPVDSRRESTVPAPCVIASNAVVNASSTATWVVQQVVDDIGMLSVEAGPDRGRTFELDRSVVRIGSGDQAEVRLSDRAVSRLHCELAIDGATLRLRDLGSKNGTWIGKLRIYEADVTAGTQVRIGETVLVIGLDKRTTTKPVWRGGDHYGSLFGASPAMHRLYLVLERLAASREPVLVRGESGTGKELVARALHERGPRPDAPFVIVDGGSLSRTLAEAELLAMRAVPSPVRRPRAPVRSSARTAARSSSTRSASCRSSCSRPCSASSRRGPCSASASRPASASRCASSPRRIARSSG